MIKYNNITIENAENMEYREMFEIIKSKLLSNNVGDDDADIISDLMIRHDEDVYETDDGQFICYSHNDSNIELIEDEEINCN